MGYIYTLDGISLIIGYILFKIISIYIDYNMNIYNNEGTSHNKSIAHAGNIPKNIVGINNDNIKNDSLYVQSAVKFIYGVFIPPVNLFVNFI